MLPRALPARGGLGARLVAPLTRAERLVLMLVTPLLPVLSFMAHAAWFAVVPDRRCLPTVGDFVFDALPWVGCAGSVLLLIAIVTSRTVTATRRAEGELLVSIPLAVLAVMLAEKLRWFLGFFFPWAGGPAEPVMDALGHVVREYQLLNPKLAVPASVLAMVWVLIAWLRIERTREAAMAVSEAPPGDVGGAG